MDRHAPLDSRVHSAVLTTIVARGHAPGLAEIAAALGEGTASIAESLRRIEANHGLVLHPGSVDVWIAHPFSLSPTAVWVASGARGWWSPCLWCATGVVALAAPDATLRVRLGGEAEDLSIRFSGGRPVDDGLVVHFPVPPRDAWANFCALVLPFRSEAEVDAWCARHALAKGAVVPLSQVADLGRAWYGRHLDVTWVKWSVPEAREIFESVGLTGPFWRLPGADGRF